MRTCVWLFFVISPYVTVVVFRQFLFQLCTRSRDCKQLISFKAEQWRSQVFNSVFRQKCFRTFRGGGGAMAARPPPKYATEAELFAK